MTRIAGFAAAVLVLILWSRRQREAAEPQTGWRDLERVDSV